MGMQRARTPDALSRFAHFNPHFLQFKPSAPPPAQGARLPLPLAQPIKGALNHPYYLLKEVHLDETFNAVKKRRDDN